jgi:hypothetical protein
MKDVLLNYLEKSAGNLSIQVILLNFLMAGIIGMVIYLSYWSSHSKSVYSPRFNVSLVMLTIVTTLVMNVIGNNVALSLGMVGALSIVRFRTAIKDSRDTVYIFWAIAVGICCGVSEYIVPSIGSGIIFIFTLIFGAVKSNERFLLVIHGKREFESEIEKAVMVYYSGDATMKVKNTTSINVEYIYELSKRILNKAEKNSPSITTVLYEIDGVESVNLVCQNEDINR